MGPPGACPLVGLYKALAKIVSTRHAIALVPPLASPLWHGFYLAWPLSPFSGYFFSGWLLFWLATTAFSGYFFSGWLSFWLATTTFSGLLSPHFLAGYHRTFWLVIADFLAIAVHFFPVYSLSLILGCYLSGGASRRGSTGQYNNILTPTLPAPLLPPFVNKFVSQRWSHLGCSCFSSFLKPVLGGECGGKGDPDCE